MTDNGSDDNIPALQGIESADWLVPATAELARQTNNRVRMIADREMECGLSPLDFTKLLIEAALRAEADADPRA
jgi:hypothetical protein